MSEYPDLPLAKPPRVRRDRTYAFPCSGPGGLRTGGPSSGGWCSYTHKSALLPHSLFGNLRREDHPLAMSEWCQEASGEEPRASHILGIWLIYTDFGSADERIRTADLISLRVIIHALLGFARAYKYCIFKPVPFCALPYVAPYCVRGGVRVVSHHPPIYSV